MILTTLDLKKTIESELVEMEKMISGCYTSRSDIWEYYVKINLPRMNQSIRTIRMLLDGTLQNDTFSIPPKPKLGKVVW